MIPQENFIQIMERLGFAEGIMSIEPAHAIYEFLNYARIILNESKDFDKKNVQIVEKELYRIEKEYEKISDQEQKLSYKLNELNGYSS